MNIPFESSATLPSSRSDPALFFAFSGDRLLVHSSEDGSTVPLLMRFDELDLPAKCEHYLGRAGAMHTYAVELEKAAQVPEGMRLSGLRGLYGSLDEEMFWLVHLGRRESVYSVRRREADLCRST